MFSLIRRLVQVRKKLTAAKNAMWPSIPVEAVSEVLYSKMSQMAPPGADNQIPDILRDQAAAGFRPKTACVRRFDGNMTIDPLSGLLFESGRVIWNSTDMSGVRERTPRFLRHRMRPRRQFDAVASLHHIFDNNYFHFFNNIAVKLPLFEAANVPGDIPLVVSERLSQQPFFRDAREMGLFGDRKIIVQGAREAIAARTVFTAKGITFLDDRERYDWVLDRLGVERQPAGGRRIFIHRGPKAINRRVLRNQVELNRLLDRYGIEAVDPQEYDLAGQIAAFASARLIIGAHGAGLTNMVFRRESPLDVIELFNPNFLNSCYFRMAQQRGYGYSCLLNHGVRGTRWTASAEVDLKGLKKLLMRISGPV